MKSKVIRYGIIIFSIVFAIRVITIFTAERLYSMSLAAERGKRATEEALTMLNTAIKLDPKNAELYFRKYEILELSSRARPEAEMRDLMQNIRKKQLYLLKKCMDLCPSWPGYHMYYALTLESMSPNPNIMTQSVILSELQKAASLKPYSKLYHQIYQKYINIYK